jgi:hypothetical protein
MSSDFETSINIPNPLGQSFCVISVVGPRCAQKTDTPLVQVLAAFPTLVAANCFGNEVSQSNPTFTIYAVPMNTWLPLHSTLEEAGDPVWCSNKVEELMLEYAANKRSRKVDFEQRFERTE